MSDRLVDDPDAVTAISARVAANIGVPASHVEKDFWVTEVLRGAAESANADGTTIVFKGGTSLSKVFGLIERFSEDVDILVILDPADTKGANDRALKRIVDGAAAATKLVPVSVPKATSKGAKRGARFHYRDTANASNGISEGVFLELGSRGGAIPSARLPVVSVLAQHAADEIAGSAEADPVLVRVLSPWRTLVEKLVLLHTAHTNNSVDAVVKGARHYYDIHRLISRPEILAGLNEYGADVLARDVCTYSRAADTAAVDRPSGGFAASPAFLRGEHIERARLEYDQRVVQQLLWPQAIRPTFDECLRIVEEHSHHL